MTFTWQKTKDSNTFRFKTFTDRINEIDIRQTALYYIGHENEEDLEDEETYFHQTIRKWTALNLTEEFNEFSKRHRDIVTLPQLIHNKDAIIDRLLEKLSTASTLSLQPVLEILVGLVKDLREYFSKEEYFQRVLDRLICLLNTQDAEQLEWTLTCLACFFKILKPFLKKNVCFIFQLILPLLNEERWSEHVINFAVECFAYIARDIVNHENLLEIVLKTIEGEGNIGIRGFGRLFFEIIRGVNGNLHVVAEKFFLFLFKSLIDPKIRQKEILYKITHEMLLHTLNFVNTSNMAVFWSSIAIVVDKSLEMHVETDEIIRIIEIIGLSIEYKPEKFTESELVVNFILKFADYYSANESVLMKISDLICCVLLSDFTKITQLDLSRMCKKILTGQYRTVFEHFVWNIKPHIQFEILILPSFLKIFESNFDVNSFELLAKLIQFKAPICEDGGELSKWKKYPIILTQQTINKLLSNLRSYIDKEVDEQYLLITIFLPHIECINLEDFSKLIKVEIKKLLKTIQENEDEVQKRIFMLAILVESILHLDVEMEINLLLDIINVLIDYSGNEKFISCLKLLNLIFAYCHQSKKVIFTSQLFHLVHKAITNNLYSPLKNFRSLTASTLNCFNCVSDLALSGIYDIFFRIECIEPGVHTYREQIVLINKLYSNGEYMKNINKSYILLDCIKFLLGTLYHNFKLLWDPTLKVIQDLVKSKVSISEFWEIYKFKMQSTAKIINKEEIDPTLTVFYSEKFCSKILQQLYETRVFYVIKVDYINYRNLLWSKLSEYGQIAEMKNKDIVILFLKFVEQEYKMFEQQRILTWNLVDPNEEFDVDSKDNSKFELKNHIKQSKLCDQKLKNVMHTLDLKLTVFKNQNNPKQIHREKELFQLYLELLTCKNPVLQKSALDCIMAYKMNSLLVYKDHLYNLIDEKKFKDELVNFNIEKESNTILAQHRPEVMQILLRILYGKMISKVVAKNMNNQVKKVLITRYLSGCEKEEIELFFEMTLKDYGETFKNDLEKMIAVFDKDFNLMKIWSAKKFQSTLNLVELIRKNFAGLMDKDFLTFILKIVIFIGYVCEKVLQNSFKISNAKIAVVYKNVKVLALDTVINFTRQFEDFEWDDNQIQLINEIFVWPNLEKLPYDCIHNPTPLLKLLCTWSENVNHFIFLTKESGKGLVSFKFVIDLLLNDKAKPVIRKTILEMIERILMVSQNENGQFDTKSLSASLIKPYIPQILKYLKSKLTARQRKKKLNKRDMNILFCLTHLVQDSETSESVLQIFLPDLIAKAKSSVNEEILQPAVMTLYNLIKNINHSHNYLKNICILFVEIKEVMSRKLLCNVLDIVAEKNASVLPYLTELTSLVKELNAWDKRWIEQPDYDRRIAAIKNIIRISDSGPVILELGILAVCNCFHFLKYDKDMGLRDNCSELLKIIIPKLLKENQHSRKDVDFIINDIVLDIVRGIIRNSNDNVRNEGVLLLGEMATNCHKFHSILNDLHILNDLQNEELDFFKNITHLQAHHHAKAMQKFLNVAKNLTELPNVKTLTQFILPLTSRYLFNEKYIGNHVLVDAAVESIGAVCLLLPWQQYQIILKYYLQKMRYNNVYQKQAVRIVVTILDSFHFDLKNAIVENKTIDSLRNDYKTELNIEEMKTNDQNLKVINAKEELKLGEELVEDDESENEHIKDENLDDELENVENECGELNESKCFMKTMVLGSSASKKVMHTIASILIPTLNNCITEKSCYDSKHKLNRKRYSIEREEEEILRVPIALALVKLLQKLPQDILETSLPGVFMKVCTFLKSPLKSVRMLARDILKKIMLTLGSKYLSLLLEQLRSLLTRGFQVHVLSVTVHGVLDTLKEQFQTGDIEACLQDLLDITLNDIFGEVADQKEIHKIGAQTPEAKPSAKSYLSLHIAARNIPESCLLDLLIPFKEYLTKSHTQKNIMKIEACFQKIIIGLVENTLLSKESLLFFIHGTISESITDLLPGVEKPKLTEKEKERISRSHSDCLLIPDAPKERSGHKRFLKTNSQTNAHILVEFGLEMLNIVLKRKKIADFDYEPFLNPIIPILNDSLKSQYIKVTAFALKCFTSIWNGNYEIEKCNEYLDCITEQIFKILHKYSTNAVVRSGENFQLVKNSFKTIVALLRSVKNFSLTAEQIGQLLFYIEQDILQTERQPIAVNLLKSIVFRKIYHEEIHNLMKKIQEVAITSQSDFLQDEIRSILINYLTGYPLKKKSDGIIKFFIMQLNYETSNGRLSAIKFLEMVIRKFPQNTLIKKAEILYLQLGTRLVNEEMSVCRLAVAECIEQLIARVNKETKEKLFNITLMLLDEGQKSAIREMAATLFSRFISVEKNMFSSRIKILLPVLISFLNSNNHKGPGRYVKLPNEIELNRANENMYKIKNELIQQEKQKVVDHELIQIQNCILKMLEFCSETVLMNKELNPLIDELVYESQKLLAYEHDWVRLNAAKIISNIISNIDCELVGQLLMKQRKIDENNISFLHLTVEDDIKSLTLDLSAQMKPGQISEKMAEEVVKIFLLFANILKVVPITHIEQKQIDVKDVAEYSKINLKWLLRRMQYIIQAEVSQAPQSFLLRSSIFDCIEGLISLLDVSLVENLARYILPPLIREMSSEDTNIDPKLRQQALRIGYKFRKIIGSDTYDKLRTEIQRKIMLKRGQRKKELAVQKVSDPIRAAKRKQSIQEKKKIIKKRKMDIVKGKIKANKKRKRKIDEL